MRLDDLGHRAGRSLVTSARRAPRPSLLPRAERRRRRRALTAALAGVGAVAVAVGSAAQWWEGPTTPASTPAAQELPPPREAPRFQPVSTRIDERRVLLPLVLADGTRLELVLPRNLADRVGGFTPAAAVADWHGEMHKSLEVYYGGIDEVIGDLTPVAEFHDASGNSVPYFDLGEGDHVLVFQFGSWVVLAREDGAHVTDDERARFASLLRGFETPEGFLVLDPVWPLTITHNGTPGGWLDGEFTDSRLIGIAAQRTCPNPSLQTGRGYAITVESHRVSVCSPEHSIAVHGSDVSIQDLERVEIRMRSVSLGAPRGTGILYPTSPA